MRPTRQMILPLIPLLALGAGCQSTGPADPQAYLPYRIVDHALPLIPREVFFGNPDRAAVRLSSNGEWISWLAPRDGVMNVWVAPRTDLAAARPVTNDTTRGIRSYFWAYNNRQILYIQDRDGDENWRVHAVDVATATTTDLTPLDGVRAEIEAVSDKFPDRILVGLNNRDPRHHDIWSVDLTTGERQLVLENPGFAGFVTDDDFTIRFAHQYNADGSYSYLQPDGAGGWKPFLDIPAEDTLTTYIAGFDQTGTQLYLADSRGRNTSALMVMDLASGAETLVAESPLADLSGVLTHPTRKTIEAASFTYKRREWTVLDEAIRADFDALSAIDSGELQIVDRTRDDRLWITAFLRDDGPLRYYLWDREARRADFLFTNRAALEGLPLAPMRPVIIPTRDGLNMVSYLTLPPGTIVDANGRPQSPVPLILHVHGGPWARDLWGLDGEHQLFANRGYAVLSVNFRGSTGFGKTFLNAAKRQWGAAMHDDLIDAVEWAVANGIAPRDRIAIMGGSYGGYAALSGVTFTPEVFACAISVVGPSNLVTLLNSIPPYWESALVMFRERVGDHTTEEGRAFLASRSPLTYVDRIVRPLMVVQGANDPRVKQAESDQIVAAMQERGIPVSYVLYPDEGHGLVRPENRLAFYAVAEAFLGRYLGGRVEPVGTAFEGSSITIPVGRELLPGVPAQ